jgi:hypothetical protein
MTSKRQDLKDLIIETIRSGPHAGDPENIRLHYLWSIEVLSELLAYSAQDQYEVWQKLQALQEKYRDH